MTASRREAVGIKQEALHGFKALDATTPVIKLAYRLYVKPHKFLGRNGSKATE